MSLSCEITNTIARITMDDGKANVMTTEWLNIFSNIMDDVCAKGARALIVSGRPKFFSGGLDVKAVTQMNAVELKSHLRHFAQVALKLHGLPIPTIAVISGHAIAGGFILASAFDYRIALDGPYKYQLSELAIGIAIPDWLPIIFESSLPRPALESIALSARILSPQEMLGYGFLTGIYDEISAVTDQAETLAAQLAQYSSSAYAASKEMLRSERIKRALASLE